MKLRKLCLYTILFMLNGSVLFAADSYYKEQPQFHPHPDPAGVRHTLPRFGPVGISLELRQPAFTLYVAGVESGSPADGKLKKGNIIESINGITLKDEDPRVILGNLITEVEATDGIMKMMVRENKKSPAKEIIVTIPVLGAYSETWPENCAKSDKIIRQFADFLDKTDKSGYGAALFLLSTGEQKDLDVVTRWFKGKLEGSGGYPWDIGYKGPAVCEYYLRTGDKSVLPHIKAMTEYLKERIYNGSWMGRGGASYKYMAGGHMNAAGIHCLTLLLMAKECGVDVDEHTLQSSLYHFYRYSGHGNVAYGDGVPEGGMVDNGRSGGLAFAMEAAANLHPDGETSVYAKARDINATKGFYATSWLFHGHTGGGIGELWRGPAMGLIKDKRPLAYRTFMDERRWMYELARTHDGAFGWSSTWNVGYDETGHKGGRSWGNHIPLIYTLPRKKLRLFGAPPTKYSHTYKLPDRPWGTDADDVFFSLEAGKLANGTSLDMSKEELKTHASLPLFTKIGDPDVSDETLLLMGHHIDQGIRAAAATAITRQGRDHLILELLRSHDPRGRHTGTHAIHGQFKGEPLPPERITAEMVELLAGMIHDPNESWWVVYEAMNCLGRVKPAWIAPHVERLAYWLDHEDWWLRKAALTALTPVATDQRLYQRILPLVGKMIATNERAVALNPVSDIVRNLQDADPAIQQYAVKILGQAYKEFPETLFAPGGQDMSDGVNYLLNGIARNLANTPGGFEELYAVATERFPDQSLPHKEIFMNGDPATFGPTVKKAFLPIVKNDLIPEYIEAHAKRLKEEIAENNPDRAIPGLVSLYQNAGISDYDWTPIGPARNEIKWDYYSYDPNDGKLWEKGSRYRKLTWPEGLENWFSSAFDPAAAGWKSGLAPFGHYDGKQQYPGGCKGGYCGCGDPINTFWEHEVLLMRTELELPPMKEGYAYRLMVGGRNHVGGGDGTDIWIDGVYMSGRRSKDPSIPGVGKRQGGKPWGRNISNTLREEFRDGKILLAATGFLRIHKRSDVKSNRQSFWFEEMKLPPVDVR